MKSTIITLLLAFTLVAKGNSKDSTFTIFSEITLGHENDKSSLIEMEDVRFNTGHSSIQVCKFGSDDIPFLSLTEDNYYLKKTDETLWIVDIDTTELQYIQRSPKEFRKSNYEPSDNSDKYIDIHYNQEGKRVVFDNIEYSHSQSNSVNDLNYNFNHVNAGITYTYACNVQNIIGDSSTKISKLVLSCDTLSEASLEDVHCDTLVLFNSIMNKHGIRFSKCRLPNEIYVSNIDMTNLNEPSKLDLNSFIETDHECKILFRNPDLSKIKFNYLYYKLIWDKNTPVESKLILYKQLREKFQKEGQDESFQKIDIEYREFMYLKDSTKFGKFQNWLDKKWWNYGYDKEKVLINSFSLFAIIVLFNLFFYRFIIMVYEPDIFKDLDSRIQKKYRGNEETKDKLLYRLNKIPGVIVYTAYVFWGIKIELDKVKFEKSWWALPFTIFIVEYLLGIVCLAYIANLIISKGA